MTPFLSSSPVTLSAHPPCHSSTTTTTTLSSVAPRPLILPSLFFLFSFPVSLARRFEPFRSFCHPLVRCLYFTISPLAPHSVSRVLRHSPSLNPSQNGNSRPFILPDSRRARFFFVIVTRHPRGRKENDWGGSKRGFAEWHSALYPPRRDRRALKPTGG